MGKNHLGGANFWTGALATVAAISLWGGVPAIGAVPSTMMNQSGSDTLSSDFREVETLPNLPETTLNEKIREFSAASPLSAQDENGRTLTQKFTSGLATPDQTVKLTATAEIDSVVALVAAKWPASGPQPLAVLGRTLKGGAWTEWETVGEEFETSADGQTKATEAWIVVNAAKVEIALVMSDPTANIQPQLEVIDPGTRVDDNKFALPETGSTLAGPVPGQAGGKDGGTPNNDPSTDDSGQQVQPQPPANAWTNVPATDGPVELLTRDAWGADPSWRTWTPRAGKVQAAVVHHTASQNDYSAEAVPGILRAIYRYHALSLKWGDIGYNVLVDNYGRAWQGRDGDFWSYNTIGAHALGVNQSTFGISVLGNYTDFRPSDAAVATVAKVITYKLPVGMDPFNMSTPVTKSNGTVIHVPVVSGHRDVGATACPGQAFYDYLPTVRKLVADYIAVPWYTVKEPNYVTAEREQTAGGIPLQLAGANRIDTSIEIAKHAFPSGTNTVYLARSDNTADALAGGALTDGPIVLVNSGQDTVYKVKSYIASTGAKRLVALGGYGAVNESTLRAVAGSASTSRLAGGNRAETAAQIAVQVTQTNPGMSAVYLAEQSKGVDALAAGSLIDGPVLLVPSSGKLPAAVSSAIRKIAPSTVIALGGTGAVSDEILNQAAAGRSSSRIAGADRYGTARAISQYRYPEGAARVYLASGSNPVDAVAGGVLTDGPILLLPNSAGATLDGNAGGEINRLGAKFVTSLGGDAAVAMTQVHQAVVYSLM
ncbi:MAG: cell wall-binding repeat-containing protein [Mobiluncus porci]|uniref:cell wall-binding repeat-containing protein n=1 Tax=Mobiluncus porci TaxID=2652278 RepID=UPI0023F313EB|nr:cell wall-binding repeat-containing protein [Mobiluncus porci]MDD7542524.1 cell wall-binding repeat-containing protein [Mobiluncus porci]MDY5748821.1 cell wall-binding repeat-containing protein [Mobiluncus porci]